MADKETQVKWLTPMDIHEQEFKKRGLSGYDRHEVDSFLDKVVNDYGDVLDHNSDLKNEIVQLRSQVNDLQQEVTKYQEVVQSAQDTIAQAKAKAQAIVDDAVTHANDEKMQAKVDTDYQRQQLETIKSDYDRVKKEAAGYRSYIQKLLQKAIDNLNDDQWQKALDEYFSTDRFYPPDGAEPITLTDADEEIDEDEDDDDIEVDNDEDVEVNFDEDDSENDGPLEGDSPQIEVVDSQATDTNNEGDTTIIFPDDYKDHN